MKRFDPTGLGRQPHPPGLDHQKGLGFPTDLPLPTINRTESRDDIRAGSQSPPYHGTRELLSHLLCGR